VAISSGQDFGYSGKNGKVRPVSEEAVEQPALTRQLPELQGSAMTQSEYPPDAPSRIWHDRISKYLPDLIFGANDGIITTLAVVSGVVGASLSTTVILILGFANLLADGFSMGVSNVLSRRSDTEATALPSLRHTATHGLATFAGFVIAGLVPLLSYLLPWLSGFRFEAATILALGTLFAVGAGRTRYTGRGWFVSGMEMLLLGALAAAVAYGVGAATAKIVGHVP
jgi:VIT1/CCC1 family predicted Fe2+/Mn2+ transporter